MRLALLQAWDKREAAPLNWTSAQRRALAAEPEPLRTPRRTPTAWLSDV
jgi:hypothetical protein